MTHKEENKYIFIESDQRPDILMEKYKLHKQEALQHQTALTRLTTYIQLYGIFLFSLSILILGNEPLVDFGKLGDTVKLLIFIGASSLLFYFVSSVTVSSYSFLILRKRMGQLEFKINELVGEPILRYENELSIKFHEGITFNGQLLTPHFWSGVWRVVLFWSGIFVLIYLFRKSVSSQGYVLIYISTISFFALMHTIDHLRLTSRIGISSIEEAFANSEISNYSNWRLLGTYLSNYIVIVILIFIVFGDSSLVSDPFINRINEIMMRVEEFTTLQIFIGIGVYTALCAVFIPTPSEAPLLLSGVVSVVQIYIISAIGKGLGSIALALFSSNFVTYNEYIEDWIRGLKKSSENTWVARHMVGRNKMILYFMCQAIPFAPMRLSTIIYACHSGLATRMFVEVFFLSAAGTIVRMYVFYSILVSLGYTSLAF
ncbi:MAG: hypothetical protein AB2715_12600 [Candidatus Thiodiazotropha sp.]